MTKVKKTFTFLMALTLSAGLVACQPAAPAGPTQPAPPTATNTGTEPAPADEPATSAEPGGVVVVYSPHDADPLNAGVNAFMEKYPGVRVEVVAAGTGELLNRVRAESSNPQADVLWGGGADSLAAFKEFFEPFVSEHDEFIGDAYKDADGLWIGESPLPMVLFFNRELLARDSMDEPTGWIDLIEPEWRGKIAYAMPSMSGSAYTQLITMLLAHGGREDGWAFIEELYDNLDGKIVDSSSKAHRMVNDGEFHVGLTLEKAAVQYTDTDRVGFIYPQDGTSAVPDGVALIAGAPNPDNARLFIDFVLSREAQIEQMENWGRRPVRSDIEITTGMASLDELILVDYDFDWAANYKEEIIDRFNDIMTR